MSGSSPSKFTSNNVVEYFIQKDFWYGKFTANSGFKVNDIILIHLCYFCTSKIIIKLENGLKKHVHNVARLKCYSLVEFFSMSLLEWLYPFAYYCKVWKF